jgi:hypothetical protein
VDVPHPSGPAGATAHAGAHPNWPERFFAQIVNKHLATTHNRGSRIGYAHSFLLDARGLLETATSEMRAAALKG